MQPTFSTSPRGGRRTVVMPQGVEGLRVWLISGQQPRHHLLMSQGMLGVYGGCGRLGGQDQPTNRSEHWATIAPVLERVWREHAVGPRPRFGPQLGSLSAEEVESVLAAAEAAGLCSFAQTLEAARHYLLGDDGSRLHALACKLTGDRVRFESIRGVSLEPVDAGHTAAVIRVGLTFTDRSPGYVALLVARDLGAAAARLSAQASDLRVWHRLCAPRAAEVFEVGTGRIRWFGQHRELTVAATRWIEGRSVRLHLGPNGTTLRDATGAAFTEAEAVAVAQQLAATRSALATFAIDGCCERTLELEQGDVLITAEHAVVLVGSAARSWWGPLGAWPYRLAAAMLPSPTRASSTSLSVAHLHAAVLAGVAAVGNRAHGAELSSAMRQQARDLALAHRALEGLVPPQVRTQVISEVVTVLARAPGAPGA